MGLVKIFGFNLQLYQNNGTEFEKLFIHWMKKKKRKKYNNMTKYTNIKTLYKFYVSDKKNPKYFLCFSFEYVCIFIE